MRPRTEEISPGARSKETDNPECKSSDAPVQDRPAQHHQERAVVHRMPYIGIGAALDEFMVFLQDNPGTPVTAESDTRPKHNDESKQADHIRDDVNRQRLWPEDRTCIERISDARRQNEGNEGDDEHRHAPALAASHYGSLGKKSTHQEEEEENPEAEKDELPGQTACEQSHKEMLLLFSKGV